MAEWPALVLSCEHGGNRIPRAYQPLFAGCQRLLDSHRGYDRGALACARALSRQLRSPLFAATHSRLLVDLNRSLSHPALFSERARALPPERRQHVLDHYYHPHREKVELWIRSRVDAGATVVHVAVHTFAPSLNRVLRRADIGLLYDPARKLEAALCRRWRAALRAAGAGTLVVRRNYPYLGVSDGFTRHLRTRFAAARYAGIELEINQRLLQRRGNFPPWLAVMLGATLRQAMRG